MKINWKVILSSTAFAAIVITTACTSPSKKVNTETEPEKPKQEMAQTQYTCPMHPEVIQNEPGKCPQCGMTLVEKSSTDSKMNMEHQEENHTMQ